MFDQVLCHDDRLQVTAVKARDQRRGKFPLCGMYKESKLLRVSGTYEFEKDGEIHTGREYGFRNSFIQERNIHALNGVKLSIHRNTISIELNNILNIYPEKSRYKLLHNVLLELHKYGIVKARCRNRNSLNARLYYLLRYFKPSAYEIRFDMNREEGKGIYQKCRLSRFYREDYNTIALSSPHKQSREKAGYYLKMYDRGKGLEGFPYRLELTFYRKRLPERMKGNPKKLISSLENQVYECTVRNTLYQEFSSFFNCIWFQDKVREYTREQLEVMGRNWNQHKKAVI